MMMMTTAEKLIPNN